ncbi:MAG: hypothetical protein U0269_16750 [Polyangiales bacterium]
MIEACSPTAQPVVDVELAGIAAAAAANGVAGDELELELFFHPVVPRATSFGGDVRRIARWSRMEPTTLRVQVPEGDYSAIRLVVRVARLCAGSSVGFQTVGEALSEQRLQLSFDRITTTRLVAMSVTRSTDCSGATR